MKTEKYRSDSAGIPLNLTIDERKSVKKVKLKTKPTTTPKDLLFPAVSTEEERIIGKIGKIQGESIVTIPAKNAKDTSIIMLY